MATLQGNTIASTFKDLLQVSNSNSGVDGIARFVEDGEGTASALKISTSEVQVSGNFTVTGTSTTIDTTNLNVDDALIQLGKDNTSSDLVDIGFVGLYDNGANDVYSGLFRDASDGVWKLFKESQEDLSTATTVNTGATGYTTAALTVGTFTSTGIDDNATSTAITIDSSEMISFAGTGNGIPIRFQDIASTPSSQTAGYIGMSTSAYSGSNGDLVLIPRTSVSSNILLMEGNVGIGTTSPDVPLEVSVAGSGVTNVLKLTTTGSGTVPALQFEGDVSGTQHIISRIRAQQDDATNGGIVFETENSGTVAERMRIDSSGNVEVSSGNLVIGTSGKGIDFSATSGEGTSELLADYEEGTWDASLTSGGGTAPTVSASENMMTYTKIGRVVFISGQVGTCNCTGSSGALTLAGLPFDTISDQTDRAERVNLIANTQNDTYSHLLLSSVVGAGGSTLTVSGKKIDGTIDSNVAGTMNGEGNFDLNIAGYYTTD